MKQYKVDFFKLEQEKDEHGKIISSEPEFIASVYVDDFGVGPNLTLVSKAYRWAPNHVAQLANKVVVNEVTRG